MEADRDRAVAQQRVVERLEREPRRPGAAAPPRAARGSAPCPAGSSAGSPACTCSGAPRRGRWRPRSRCARPGSRSPRRRVSSPRCIRTSRMIRHARQIASVYIATRNAGPASKPSSRIICSEYMPQPSTNSGASVEHPGQARWWTATASWRWWPGYASWMLVFEIEPSSARASRWGRCRPPGVTM